MRPQLPSAVESVLDVKRTTSQRRISLRTAVKSVITNTNTNSRSPVSKERTPTGQILYVNSFDIRYCKHVAADGLVP